MITGPVAYNGTKRIPFRGRAIRLQAQEPPPAAEIIRKPAKPQVPKPLKKLSRTARPQFVNPEHYKPGPEVVALVVAGAECFQHEVKKAKALLKLTGRKPLYFLANDQIATFAAEPAIGVTLHPQKLVGWIEGRKSAGLPPLLTVWAHRSGACITHVRRDPNGSVSLMAVYCAMDIGIKKILLCGAPMTQEAGHFIRKRPWKDVGSFRSGWHAHKTEIAPCVRSFSGWTKDLLGEPDPTWMGERL